VIILDDIGLEGTLIRPEAVKPYVAVIAYHGSEEHLTVMLPCLDVLVLVKEHVLKAPGGSVDLLAQDLKILLKW